MTDLTKDEIVKMAREAGAAPEDGVSGFWVAQTEDLQRFATLCRAPLVAEVERLKKMSVANIMVRIVPGYDGGGEEIYAKSVEEVNAVMSDLSQRLDDVETDRDDWKARALKAEQVGEPVAYIAWKNDKPCYEGDDAICEDAVWPVDSDDYRTSMPVFTAPQPAAQESTSAVPVVEQLVEALSRNRIMAADADGNYTKEVTPRIITAAIVAGQKYLKENKHA